MPTKLLDTALNELGVIASNRQMFSTPGTSTWVNDPSYKMVLIRICSGGGGGGSGCIGATNVNTGGGAGGTSGFYHEVLIPASDLPATVEVVVGAGGTGGAATTGATGNAGGAGGDSRFGTTVFARGGFAGPGGTTSGSAVAPTFQSTYYGNSSIFGIYGSSGGQGGFTGSGIAGSRAGFGPGGGGGGAAVPSNNNSQFGGEGGQGFGYQKAVPNSGLASGGGGRFGGNGGMDGGDGQTFGDGGGGGESRTTGTAGKGGNGREGGGGGGGGANRTGGTAGAGGNGGNGFVEVLAW